MKKPPEDTRSDARPAGNLIQRRRLVKVVAAGGGVATGAALIPSKWTQPIIESVTLPVHAQTTTQVVRFSGPINPPSGSLVPPHRSPIDSLLAPAHAAVSHAPIADLFGGCCGTVFHLDLVEIFAFAPGGGAFFGSYANPNSLAFDVELTGPYLCGVFPTNLPYPNSCSLLLIGNGGSVSVDLVPDGVCSASLYEPTPE